MQKKLAITLALAYRKMALDEKREQEATEWVEGVTGDLNDAGAVETAALFLRRKAGHAKPSDMLPFLDRAGNEPPREGDEVEKP